MSGVAKGFGVSEPTDVFCPRGPDLSGVQPYERKQLIERVEREGATVGETIPETIDVQGRPLELREFVFELTRREEIPPGEQETVDRAKTNLRRERRERLEQLENGDITHEEGERLAMSIVGIDRALNALENLGPTDLEAEAKTRETADRKRWMNFLRQALGQDDEAATRRGR